MRTIRRAYKRKYRIDLIEAIMNKCGVASPLIAHIAAKETSGVQNKVGDMEYIVHGSKNQNDSKLKLTLERFA